MVMGLALGLIYHWHASTKSELQNIINVRAVLHGVGHQLNNLALPFNFYF